VPVSELLGGPLLRDRIAFRLKPHLCYPNRSTWLARVKNPETAGCAMRGELTEVKGFTSPQLKGGGLSTEYGLECIGAGDCAGRRFRFRFDSTKLCSGPQRRAFGFRPADSKTSGNGFIWKTRCLVWRDYRSRCAIRCDCPLAPTRSLLNFEQAASGATPEWSRHRVDVDSARHNICWAGIRSCVQGGPAPVRKHSSSELPPLSGRTWNASSRPMLHLAP